MKNKRKVKFIKTLLLAVIIVCLVQIGRSYYLSMQHKAQQNTLKEMMETPSKYTTENTNDTPKAFLSILADQNAQDLDSNKEQTENEPVILSRYSDLYKENSDLIGWLSIDGMEIDYPVMQCEDDEYYLHHDFYGNDSKYGCLYVRKEADINTGSNFIIYGHNMKDGSMFGDLDSYLKESFIWNTLSFLLIRSTKNALTKSSRCSSHKYTMKMKTHLNITDFTRQLRKKNLMTSIGILKSFPCMIRALRQNLEIPS